MCTPRQSLTHPVCLPAAAASPQEPVQILLEGTLGSQAPIRNQCTMNPICCIRARQLCRNPQSPYCCMPCDCKRFLRRGSPRSEARVLKSSSSRDDRVRYPLDLWLASFLPLRLGALFCVLLLQHLCSLLRQLLLPGLFAWLCPETEHGEAHEVRSIPSFLCQGFAIKMTKNLSLAASPFSTLLQVSPHSLPVLLPE